MESRSVLLADAAATQALGHELALQWLSHCEKAAHPPVLLLRGDLGAGKTCLVQGIAVGLGIDEAITSPTYALAQHYSGRRTGRSTALVHLDLYRLEQPSAADELFFQEEEEAVALNAMLAVEWSERLSFPPENAWEVELTTIKHREPDEGRVAYIKTIPRCQF